MPNLRASLLLVDDQALTPTCLSELLAKHGYGVRSAPDGFSALAEIREDIPDLVLSDLNMPGMFGFELLSVVRRRFPSIRVIAMSGAFSGADVPVGVAADAFYEKGTHPGPLLRIVEDLTHPRKSPVIHRPRSLAPIWIPINGHAPAGEPFVIVTCTECLRTFPKILGGPPGAIHHTDCIYCHFPIQYAIVHSALAA
jgi:CheY-like chemotaxis protein